MEQLFPIHLVVIDYLALLGPNQGRQRREEMANKLDAAKQMAMSLNGGRGVPVVTPWQMNRDGRKGALQTGSYDLSDLADTAQAGRSADVVVALLRTYDGTEMKLDVLKNRDGQEPRGIRLDFDLKCGWFAEKPRPGDLVDFDGDDLLGLEF